MGALMVTFKAREPRYFLVAAWVWLSLLLGSVLTVDALFSPRLIGVIPALLILPALVLDAGWRGGVAAFGERARPVLGVVLGGFLTLALLANVNDYFRVHIREHQPRGFWAHVSAHVNELDGRYVIYMMGNEETSLKYETFRFLAPGATGFDFRERAPDLPLPPPAEPKGAVFIVQQNTPNAAARMAQIKRTYPNGQDLVWGTPSGVPLMASYRVELSELLRVAREAGRG
jgi:hypothetical protein